MLGLYLILLFLSLFVSLQLYSEPTISVLASEVVR
jgi:hypothetical protein